MPSPTPPAPPATKIAEHAIADAEREWTLLFKVAGSFPSVRDNETSHDEANEAGHSGETAYSTRFPTTRSKRSCR